MPGMEDAFVIYLKKASEIYFGLSPKEVRQLAFDLGKSQAQTPNSWMETKVAGFDWFEAFLKRHPTLAIRIPQATSLSRAASFHASNSVQCCFFSSWLISSNITCLLKVTHIQCSCNWYDHSPKTSPCCKQKRSETYWEGSIS